MQTERDVVLALAEGRVSSPQSFCGNTFMRVLLVQAGAYADADGQVRVRDPAEWITDHMAARAIGTPVVCDDLGMIDGENFRERVKGFVLHAYCEHDRLMAVVRLFPNADAAVTDAAGLHVRADADSVYLDATGDKVLIEHPRWLDHVVI
jgi:hypothetical protein